MLFRDKAIIKRSFRIKYKFIELFSNIFNRSLFVNFLDKSFSHGVSIVVEVKVVVHELNSGLNHFVMSSSIHLFLF